MKRLIICAAALITVFSAVSVRAEDMLVTKDKYRENVVLGLGLADSALREKEFVSRADFALTLSALINEPAKASGKTSYDDVAAGTRECGAIENLRSKNLMVGIGDNKFAPDLPIGFSEAAELIMKATYNIVGLGSDRVVSKENYSRLTKGARGDADGKISYATLVTLVYNSLDITVFPFELTAREDIVTTKKNDDTVLEKFLGLKRINGVLETDLYGSIKELEVDGGSISIDGESYRSDRSYGDFLGCNVDCFVDIDTERVVFLTASDKNRITTIAETDITDYGDRAYKYTVDGRTKKKSIGYETDIAYNDRVMATYDETKMTPKNGYVVFIDNDNDGSTEVIRITDYVNICVSGVSTDADGAVIYDRSGGVSAEVSDEQNSDRTVILDPAGVEKKLSHIRTGMIISVVGDMSDGVIRARKIIINNESISITVTGIDFGDRLIQTGDKQYYAAVGFDMSQLEPGREYTLGLDYRGRIAATDAAVRADLPMAVGYVMRTGIDFEKERCFVKLLTPYNKTVTYTCADRVTVDGAGRITDQSALENLFTVNMPVLAYTVDEDRQINRIAFAADYSERGPGSVPSSFGVYKTFASGGTKYEYYQYFKSFWGKMTVNDGTVMFVVPENENGAGEEEYKVEPISKLKSEQYYSVDGYVFDNRSIACDVAVVRTAIVPEVAKNDRIAVVGKIVKTINEDDDAVDLITLVGDSGEVRLCTSDNAVSSSAARYDNPDVTNMKIGVGDVILYAVDKNNDIAAIQLVYDCDKDTFYSGDAVDDGKYNTRGRRILMGNIYSADKENIYLASDKQPLSSVGWDNIQAVPLERMKIVVSEDDGASIRAGSAADILSFREHGTAARAIVNTYAYIGYVLVVFR